MFLHTERLLLRPWELADAGDLYTYAKDPAVGPIAGWPPHQDIVESRRVIETVFNGPECYAICRKEDGRAIGAIELMLKDHTDLTEREDECELGYWLGKPFWGQGYMPEAAKALIRRAFGELDMSAVWCAYYDGNLQSRRVQEKCGFQHQRSAENVPVPLLGEQRTTHINLLTKTQWLER